MRGLFIICLIVLGMTGCGGDDSRQQTRAVPPPAAPPTTPPSPPTAAVPPAFQVEFAPLASQGATSTSPRHQATQDINPGVPQTLTSERYVLTISLF